MNIKTYEDCRKAGIELGLHPDDIAAAHDIVTPDEEDLKVRLDKATTQEERWTIMDEAPLGGTLAKLAAESIIANVTKQVELLAYYDDSPKLIKRIAGEAFVARASKRELWAMYKRTGGESGEDELRRKVLMAMCSKVQG